MEIKEMPKMDEPHMARKKRLMDVMQQIHAAHGGLIAEHQMSEAPAMENEDLDLSDEADGEASEVKSAPEGSDEHGDMKEKRKERMASVMKGMK